MCVYIYIYIFLKKLPLSLFQKPGKIIQSDCKFGYISSLELAVQTINCLFFFLGPKAFLAAGCNLC